MAFFGRRFQGSKTAFWLGCAVVSLILVSDVAADEESTGSGQPSSPRHRVDFGVQWYDAAEGDSVTGSLNYSWVPLDHHALSETRDCSTPGSRLRR